MVNQGSKKRKVSPVQEVETTVNQNVDNFQSGTRRSTRLSNMRKNAGK